MNVDTHDKALGPRPLRREERPAPENAELAELFRRIEPRRPLHELAVQRIRRGLEQRIRPQASRRKRWTRAVLTVAASLFLIETFAALAISAWPASRHALMTTLRPPQAPVNPGPTELADRRPFLDQVPLPVSAPYEPPVPPGLAVQPSRTQRLKKEQAHAVATSHGGVTDRSIDDAEVSAYLGALAELNARNHPAKALRLLETYRSRYPGGLFRDEVAVAEVRADMALNREPQALAILDGMQTRAFAGLPQADELALLRVELLGRADRCAEALTLLVSDLPPSLPPAQREQLLFERGACDAQLGNLESSQQDLRDYLRQFPHGRFEAELRQRIARAVPASE